jgi:hypothetical protein
VIIHLFKLREKGEGRRGRVFTIHIILRGFGQTAGGLPEKQAWQRLDLWGGGICEYNKKPAFLHDAGNAGWKD